MTNIANITALEQLLHQHYPKADEDSVQRRVDRLTLREELVEAIVNKRLSPIQNYIMDIAERLGCDVRVPEAWGGDETIEDIIEWGITSADGSVTLQQSADGKEWRAWAEARIYPNKSIVVNLSFRIWGDISGPNDQRSWVFSDGMAYSYLRTGLEEMITYLQVSERYRRLEAILRDAQAAHPEYADLQWELTPYKSTWRDK